jgi:hypothetical protein
MDMVPREVKMTIIDWFLSGERRLRLYLWLRPQLRSTYLNDETRLVIDGYPRSANSYSWAAFTYSNGPDVQVAHHMHSSAAVSLAARRKIPTVLLVRHPLEAVVSQLFQYSGVSPRRALKRYARYYEHVEDVLDSVVVAPFDLAISDFGRILAAVNFRFGTAFTPYQKTEASERLVRERVEDMDRTNSPIGVLREHAVSRPSSVRTAAKPRMTTRVTACAEELDRAVTCYERILREVPPPRS